MSLKTNLRYYSQLEHARLEQVNTYFYTYIKILHANTGVLHGFITYKVTHFPDEASEPTRYFVLVKESNPDNPDYRLVSDTHFKKVMLREMGPRILPEETNKEENQEGESE